MKRFIQMIVSWFNMRNNVVWLSLADRVMLEPELKGFSGDSKTRRSVIRKTCIRLGIAKPWSWSSLESRAWKKAEV
jgi:hypothetical protein